jgi:2,4-dienoyl-CoA reductase [(3E)-enoyl-CoA-producing], peroxisomal
MFSPSLLNGRAALVTGGGTGICRGIALAFARHGCDVAITSRKTEHLDPTVRELAACGVRSAGLAADVRDAGAIAAVVDHVAASFGRLDVLVNGVAGNFLCLVEQLSPNGFGTVIDIDLKGTFNTSKAALPWLKSTRGVVLNISATLHYGGTPAQAHVAAAKAGVDALTRNLAVEWGPHGIRVVGLAPGPIDATEGVSRLLTAERREAVSMQVPLGRLGAIDDVATAALFLCSDLASYINGATLVIDGGLSLATARMIGP